jgi:hypothetical protein
MSPTKILGVDDEPDFELLITQRFRREVRSGEFAFRFAQHGDDRPQLLGNGSAETVDLGPGAPHQIGHRSHVLYFGFVLPERQGAQDFCGI